jgi:hypothetical protein
MNRFFANIKGFTVAEMATVLTTVSILGAAAAPAVGDWVNDARMARARDDTHAIAAAVSRMTADVLGHETVSGGWATYSLLVSPAPAPTLGTGAGSEWTAAVGANQAGLLEDQLMLNGPGYPVLPRTQTNVIRGWHGPYLEAGVGADPWGHRYAVNVKYLTSDRFDTFVISAGPNGTVETPFQGDGTVAHGDDIIVIISAGS